MRFAKHLLKDRKCVFLRFGPIILPNLLYCQSPAMTPHPSCVRGRTPVRQLSPTPLTRHRSRSREPSQCRLGGAPLSEVCQSQGRSEGRSETPDQTAYFSRPGSSLSLYGGRGSAQPDPFRLAMEAKQVQEDQVSWALVHLKSQNGPSKYQKIISLF